MEARPYYILHYAVKMIHKNKFQTDSYLFIVLISVIALPYAHQTKQTTSETSAVVKDSRLQQTWILASN